MRIMCDCCGEHDDVKMGGDLLGLWEWKCDTGCCVFWGNGDYEI